MHSSSAVRMAVGCLLELAFKVAAGEIKVRGGLLHTHEGGARCSSCPFARLAVLVCTLG